MLGEQDDLAGVHVDVGYDLEDGFEDGGWRMVPVGWGSMTRRRRSGETAAMMLAASSRVAIEAGDGVG